jgi:glycosyltransferase involved in cell wall biosynthesis
MVTPGYYPIEGGTETVVRNLSTELRRFGIDTDVMAFNMDQKWKPKWRGKIEKIDGTTVFKIPALNWLPMVHSPRINLGVNLIPGRFMHLLKEYDIIHFHEAEFSFPLFSFLVKKPKILHVHGINFGFLQRYHLSRLMLNHSANLYLAITKQMKRELVRLGIPENKIIYFPNSVDTRIYHPGKEKRDNTLLYVGRLIPGKCVHVLLKSLNYIKTPLHLRIIGPPGWNLDYNREVLKSIETENRNGKHKITYLDRVDPNSDQLVKCYQEASIFVLPSLFEPFGVVILEALACETPVVATQVGGIPEVVKNGENGLLVPVNDHLELAKAIQHLLDNKDVRVRFGKAGRKWVLKNFSLEVSTNRLSNIYKKMLSES